MKRLISLLLTLCLLACCLPAALAEGAAIQAKDMPAEVAQYFSAASFSGYTIGPDAALKIDNTAGGNYFFAVTTKEGHNVLHMFRQKDGAYQHVLRTDSAIPQGKGFFSLQHQSDHIYLFNGNPLRFGDAVFILFTLEEYEEQGYASVMFTVNKNGVWNLALACVSYLWREVVPGDNSLTYYYEGEREGAAYGTLQTDLRYFSFASFPKTVAEAREKLSNPPEIPYSDILQAKRVKFTGGRRYAVYTGPGEKFYRAADGKAAVSTNDWIQVFGVEDGWAMIQYDLTSDQCRIGWIDASALPKNAAVSALRFNDQPALITASADLTDDPLMSRSFLATLPKGRQVTWLATLGQWAYVQDDQSWLRGFVPVTAISMGAEQTFASQPVTGFGYIARGVAVVQPDKSARITATVEAASAPGIQSYQVYANNTLIGVAYPDAAASAAGSTVFTAQLSIPQNASVIGLCPVYAAGVKAEEAITIFVGP